MYVSEVSENSPNESRLTECVTQTIWHEFGRRWEARGSQKHIKISFKLWQAFKHPSNCANVNAANEANCLLTEISSSEDPHLAALPAERRLGLIFSRQKPGEHELLLHVTKKKLYVRHLKDCGAGVTMRNRGFYLDTRIGVARCKIRRLETRDMRGTMCFHRSASVPALRMCSPPVPKLRCRRDRPIVVRYLSSCVCQIYIKVNVIKKNNKNVQRLYRVSIHIFLRLFIAGQSQFHKNVKDVKRV